MVPPPDMSPAPRRAWSRRRIAVGVVVLLAIVIRAALPAVLRSVLEDQGTALLQGRLTVGDVDLSLLRGLVTLEDVALRPDDAGPDTTPLVACQRLWVNLGWTALARRTVEVQDVGVAGLSLQVDRLADGELVLPTVRETGGAEAPPPAPEAEPSKPWDVVIDRLTLENASVQLDDHVTDPPEARRLSLPTLRLTNFRLQPEPGAAAGRGRVRMKLRDGLVELRTRVRAVEDGFDLAMALEVTDLPLDRVHVHLPALGWSGSTGRLNGIVTARVSPSMPLVARGSVEVDDVAVEVPGEDRPALAWRSLDVDVEKIDLAARHASIERVALDGGRVLVRPARAVPLPVLPGGGAAPAAPASGTTAGETEPATGGAEVEAAAGADEPEEETRSTIAAEREEDELEEEEPEEPSVTIEEEARPDDGDDEESAADVAPLPDSAADRPAPSARPAPSDEPRGAWTWTVGRLAVTDTTATVFLEPPPLDVDVRRLDVKGLSSERGSEATVDAEIGIADGTLALDGPLVLDPVGGALAVKATDLDVGRLVAATGSGVPPFTARLDAELDVAAREDPLVVRGPITLRDVEAKADDGDDFLVAWKRLAVAFDRVAVPGLLPIGKAPGIGPIDVHVASAELDEPRVVTTLTADGLVLPTAPGADTRGPATASADAASTDAPAAGASPTAEPLSLLVDRLVVRDGDVRFTDTTVTPAYRGRLARLDVDARRIRVPENRVGRITLSTRVGGKAPVEVTSVRKGDAVTVTGTLRDVPLSQFNPYATAYGYRIAKGTLSLDSETTLRGDAYDSENRLNLDRLSVTDSRGDALFKKTFGVPLSVALALLKDLNGRISLGIPISGDKRGTGVAIGPIVRESLARALVGALASPLKLLGAVKLGSGTIQAFDPEPIAFRPGTTEIASDSKAQVRQLAGALRQLPALRIQLAGRAGANDARALAEQAVLAELDAEGGVVGGVRNLLSGGTRSNVRNALRARAAGDPGPLEGDAAAQLDAWVAEHPVDQERLLALATERATTLEASLVESGGRPEQIVVAAPKARRKSGLAEVRVEVAPESGGDDEPG